MNLSQNFNSIIKKLDKYAVIRYGTPDNFYLDIMARIGEIADYDTIEYEVKVIDNQKIKVATAEALYKLKSNTVRPQDKSDAIFLKELIKQKGKS